MSKPLARILYVEDEPDIRAIAQMALEAVGGFTVIACASGSEALANAPGASADLLLLDVMMPGMDGPSTLKALRELSATAQTPVIFMTAKVQAAGYRVGLALVLSLMLFATWNDLQRLRVFNLFGGLFS